MNEEQLRAQLNAVYSSTSWRITAPLRTLSGLVRAGKLPRARIKSRIVSILRFLAKSEMVRRIGKRVLSHTPKLRNKLQGLLLQPAIPTTFVDLSRINSPKNLQSAETEAILKQIKMMRKEF